MRYPFLKISIATVLLFFQFLSLSYAQDIPPRPNNKDLVFDYANFLSKGEKQSLNQKLEDFALETSNQILFISVESLNDLEPYEFAEGILSTWGVGQKDLNNGVVILVKPKTQASRGQVFISVGYGLEGAIPDATAKLIVENEMLPEFKNGNNYNGVLLASETLMSLAIGEINSGEYQKRTSEGKEAGWFPVFMFLMIMFFIFIGRAGRTRRYARTNNLSFWAAFWLLSNSGSRHGGSWGGFSGGSGGFGGGGGGFGGFGGGMGGGGGAGGSW